MFCNFDFSHSVNERKLYHFYLELDCRLFLQHSNLVRPRNAEERHFEESQSKTGSNAMCEQCIWPTLFISTHSCEN